MLEGIIKSIKILSILFILILINQDAKSEFDPYLDYKGEVFSNLDGGQKRSTQFQGVLELGINLKKKSNKFHISTLWLSNSNDPSYDLIGNYNQVSNITGEAAFRLYRLHWEHHFNEKFHLKIGQLALDDNFMLNQSASLFLNANFGPLGVLSANNLAPQYPLGALGLWLGWDISATNSIQMGIYDGNAGSGQDNQDGIDFHLSSSEGATIFLESNWSFEDSKFQLGSFIDTGKVFNYSNNQKVRGNYGLYLGIDHVLKQSLNMFFRVGYTPTEKRNMNDFYLDLGIVGDGFYKNDKWGLSYIYIQV